MRSEKAPFKGTTANHLLNFKHQAHGNKDQPRYRPKKTYQSKSSGSRRTFVEASFRFVLGSHLVDEAQHLMGEGVLDWDFVVEVLVPGESHMCPLCLDVPVCPRVNPCGHSYCYACVLRLEDTHNGECPVCHAHWKHVRPARLIHVPDWNDRKIPVEFTLVARRKGTCLVLPMEQWSKRMERGQGGFTYFPSVSDIGAQFCKYTVGDESEIVNAQIAELQAHLLNIEEQPLEQEMLPYWTLALDQLREHEKKIGSSSRDAKALRQYTIESTAAGSALSLDDFFFMYQSSDGRYAFLSSFSMKLLLADVDGDVMRLPRVLRCPWIEKVAEEQTEASAKRFKHLNHLAIGTSFWIVEASLEGVLSASTLKRFGEEIQSRTKHRKQKEKRQAQQDKRHEEAVKQRLKQEALEQRQPLAFVLSEEDIRRDAPPEIKIVESEVRKNKGEKKYLSYAAVASPTGEYKAPPQPSAPAVKTAASSPTRPSFADKVKASNSSSNSSNNPSKQGKSFKMLK